MTASFYPDLSTPLRTVAGWQVHAHPLKLQSEGRATAADGNRRRPV